MKDNPRNFNDAAKLFLLIAAFSAVKSIIKGLQIIGINGMLGYSTSGHVLQIVFGVITIAAIVLTLMRKRYGLISLLLIAVSEMFVTYQPGSMMSFSYHMGVQVAEFVFNYGLFLIAMCFKKDGLSGWVAMLASEEYVIQYKSARDISADLNPDKKQE